MKIVNSGQKSRRLAWPMPRIMFDETGKYGLSEHAWGISVNDDTDYELVWKAVNTEKWKQMWNYIKWTQYATEVKFFKYLRKDFWKWFVDEQGNELK